MSEDLPDDSRQSILFDEDSEYLDEEANEEMTYRKNLFGFYIDDCSPVKSLQECVRTLIARPSTTPKQLVALSKLLFGLQRLPIPTPGINIILELGQWYENGESTAQILTLDECSFRLETSSYVINESAGGDSVGSTAFEAEVGGYRDLAYPEALYVWVEDFASRACTTEWKIHIIDQDSTAQIDWEAELGDEYWEKLDSDYA